MADRSIRLKEEPEYERLIRFIQNREGHAVPAHEREAACVDLMQTFRYLIKRVATQTWRQTGGETRSDWEHDTLTTFFELMVSDYTPHSLGGAAMFGPYIKQKLYFKMLYRAQRLAENWKRERPTSLLNQETIAWSPTGRETNDFADIYSNKELSEALLANAMGIEDEIIGQMRDTEIIAQLLEIEEIVAEKLDERARFIWDKFFHSSMLIKDIGEQLEPRISTSRVNQLINAARTRVLEELGRRRVTATLSR